MAEPPVSAPVVTVRGDAQLEGPPDLATLTLTLHASGDSAERTRGQLAEGSVAVAELLQGYEAAIERSSTSGVHVAPVFNRRTPT
ncbi:MAG TPA: SIMPL domain-containing protein, partial [Propionibacteriaceae bacterium]